MMYMVLVGEERGVMLAYAHHVHPEHIEARDDEGGEGEYGRLEDDGGIGRVGEQLDAEDAEDQADGERAGVAHEYLGVFLGIAKHVVVEEGDQDAERSKRDGGVGILAHHEERHAIYDGGDGAEARCESVDTVDEVDGVDYEHYHHGCERNGQ